MLRIRHFIIMRYTHFASFALAVLVLSGCRKDESITPTPDPPVATTGKLRLTLVPEWEGQPMQRFTEYRNFSDYRMTIELLKMHLGEIQLLNADTVAFLADATYWDLGNGPVSQEWTVPVGSWPVFLAALGIRPELNYADPAAYGPNHPLNVSNGTYWNWATGYRFVMFEGRYDPDPASTATLISAFAIHTGMDTCYTDLDLTPSTPIVIEGDRTTEVVVRIAVDRFFYSSTGSIDLATENTAHGNNIPLALKFTRHVKESLSVQ